RLTRRLRHAVGPDAAVTADAGPDGMLQASVTAPAAALPALSAALTAAGFPGTGTGQHGSADPFLPAEITVTAV
ncbi:hypothetical protein, partial [Arthrobacter sp.]|uniref:hypothetical protein n=1 Tax=Arthrobacter sp. TaxID=1667 RepID=UPI00289A113F